MKHIAIIGCGVIGATIAYELSQLPDLKVTVFDRQHPAQAATGAALGVLMGIISQKTKGRAWAMRQTSLRRYETLIPELEAAIGYKLPYNRQGILMLCFSEEELPKWKNLIDLRQSQGWQLELWHPAQVQTHCPQIQTSRLVAAVYSPEDRQIDPVALTVALVQAAQKNGVTFAFNTEVQACLTDDRKNDRSPNSRYCYALQTATETLAIDQVVLAAGLGSTPLTQTLEQAIDIRPVLGQALLLRLEDGLGEVAFQPVITGEDIHIVPLQAEASGAREYWVGATVELPTETGEVLPADADRLQEVWQGAIVFCPELANATILKTWAGLRPRPHSRPAPIVEPLTGYDNVLLATGHYRNGILLAPATAMAVRQAVLDS